MNILESLKRLFSPKKVKQQVPQPVAKPIAGSSVVVKTQPHLEQDIRVDIDDFLNKYIKGACISEELMDKITSRSLKGYNYIYLTRREIDECECSRRKHLAFEAQLNRTAENNNAGILAEKEGRIEDAIKIYEKNIVDTCYPACHAFDRLMIIYRKQKDYENEIRVIDRAINVLCSRYPDLLEKYTNRKYKAQALLSKVKR